MATSGVTTFNQTRDQLISDSYINLNVIAPGESVSPDDSQIAISMLNKMIKAWEGQGVHLWGQTFGTIFLQKNQNKYTLNSSGDHATNSYIATYIDGALDSGSTSITVDSTAGMTADDNIGLYLDTGYRFWSTIVSVDSSTTLTINDAITSDVDNDTKVYTYTNKLGRPLRIQRAYRGYGSTDLNDPYSMSEVKLMLLSRSDYLDLPNKRNPSTPNSFYYDIQLTSGYFYVWGMPTTASDIINFSYSRSLDDVTTASDNIDFPQEWLLPITANLSLLLAPTAEKTGEQIKILKGIADSSLATALSYDDEQGSLYFTPNYEGR